MEPGADDPKLALKEFEGKALEFAAGMDAALMEEGGDAGTDATDIVNRDMGEPLGEVFGLDDDEAVGFLLFGGEFGEEFVRGDTDGAGEIKARFEFVFDRVGDVFSGAEEVKGGGDIEERFVDRGDFNEGSEVVEHIHDGLGGMDVFIGVAGDEVEDGATAACFVELVTGFDTGAFGGVRGGEDNRAMPGSDDSDGAILE